MNKKPREVGFVVVDDRALLGVIYTHLKHFETMDDGVVVSDDLDRRITDFDSGEFFRCVKVILTVGSNPVVPNSMITGVECRLLTNLIAAT